MTNLFEGLEHLMTTPNRFDLEQQILKCWNITDDVEELYKLVGDSPQFAGMKAEHEDMIMNYLLGLRTIYECKFQSLFAMFEQMVNEEQIK